MPSAPKLLSAIALVLLLFAACGGDDGDGAGDDGSGDGDDTAGSTEVTVEASDFMFTPNELSVDAGADVAIEFSNAGEAPHTFTAEALEVDVRLDPGGAETISFTAPEEDATIEWMCTIHPQMTGSLVVGGGSATSKSGGGSDDMNSLDY